MEDELIIELVWPTCPRCLEDEDYFERPDGARYCWFCEEFFWPFELIW